MSDLRLRPPPGSRYVINSFLYEGIVDSVRAIETRTGRPMAAAWLSDRAGKSPTVKQARKRSPKVWLEPVAFDEHAAALLALPPGQRVLLKGNVANPPRGKYGFRTKWVVTNIKRIETDSYYDHVPPISAFWFEGKLSRDPALRQTRNTENITIGAWQPGVAIPRKAGDHFNRRVTQPIVLNALAPGVMGEECLKYQKGDEVLIRGYIGAVRNGSAAWPVVDRIYPIDADFFARKSMMERMEILAPEEALIEI